MSLALAAAEEVAALAGGGEVVVNVGGRQVSVRELLDLLVQDAEECRVEL